MRHETIAAVVGVILLAILCFVITPSLKSDLVAECTAKGGVYDTGGWHETPKCYAKNAVLD